MLDGYLYAIGGEDGPWVHRSVERFDPATNTWSPVADMVICRKYAGICLFCSINTYFYIKWLIYFAKGVVTHGGLLYVVGGDDLTTEDLNSMEVYNPTTNTWLMHPIPMGIGRSFAGIALIDRPF